MAIVETFEHLVESTLGRWLDEPAPPYAFEFSQNGLAWAGLALSGRGQAAANVAPGFQEFAPGTLAISPVKDNVLRPEELQRAVLTAATAMGLGAAKKVRPAALILPDYSTRVTVLDFESFPAERAEQLSLVRFRMKKAVPFELEDAAISYSARAVETPGSRKFEVVAAAAPMEVVARYEAPLRAAGFAPGFVTSSALATMDLLAGMGLVMTAKLAGRVLTVTVSEGERLKLVRCVEIDGESLDDVTAVLGPTVVFAEDELPAKPSKILLCGFGTVSRALAETCERELGLQAAALDSPWGAPDATNAGLHGYLLANGKGK